MVSFTHCGARKLAFGICCSGFYENHFSSLQTNSHYFRELILWFTTITSTLVLDSVLISANLLNYQQHYMLEMYIIAACSV